MTRWSEFYVHTTREVPSDAEVISHQLMVRAGLIKKLAAGIYTYLPLGWRSVAKMAAIVRREMDAAGAVELSMPAIQPAELWQESGRWQRYGKELLRMRDRHDREFCFGPTHEEVVTDLVRRDVRSYRQLPFNLYQIQTKFRDEIRPRFGLMRGREFLMKDAYSFGATEAQLDEAYEAMRRAYCAIFAACKLEYTMVEADTGTIGGSSSHEFMVVAQTGESAVVSCPCGYGANVEKAESRLAPAVAAEEAPEERRAVPTPGKSSVPDVAAFLGVPPERVVKTLIYETEKEFVAALVRGDREINEVKLQNALAADHLALASEEKVERLTGAALGFAGPIGLPAELRLIADESVRELRNFVCGANEADTHLVGVNWGRDLPLPPVADLLLVAAGDPCPRCGAPLQLSRGIEVGHIFKLGTKYSEAMRCHFTDETGAERPMIMGCYGLGIGRTVAAAIEQNHDADGIVWPLPLAPFEVLLVTLNAADEETRRVADELHARLGALGIEVLYDDRDERPGVKFKDADLVGIPLRVVVGGKSLAAGQVEISHRRDRAKEAVPVAEGLQSILARLAAEGRKTPA
ncbi:MAG: proline--tRNA ligase [Thermoanaerobaculia bacterium]|nr:proline--tRNA ligase [Thermoanaerobaculia bacterium]MCZ7651452.1 proline--tRNA ligase [Thermoanaerobaculia bacterium]